MDGRFIPAGAGNTAGGHASRRPLPVHPRWRGEHVASASMPASLDGSSPLARGTRALKQRIERQRRFIPAGAGNTADAGREADY